MDKNITTSKAGGFSINDKGIRIKDGTFGYVFGNEILQKGWDIDFIIETCYWLPAECFKNIVDINRKCYDI